MATRQDNDLGEPIGFGGLAALVTDVDGVVARAEAKARSIPKPPKPSPAAEANGSRTITWWIVAAGALLLWLVIAGVGSEDGNSGPSVARSRSTTSGTSSSGIRLVEPVAQPEVRVSPLFPRESVPPVGMNHTLGADQIRYCLSESIRLEAVRDVIETNAKVVRFNSLIDDWNRRCSSYEYRQGLLETVRRQVEGNRANLSAEGIARFGRAE